MASSPPIHDKSCEGQPGCCKKACHGDVSRGMPVPYRLPAMGLTSDFPSKQDTSTADCPPPKRKGLLYHRTPAGLDFQVRPSTAAELLLDLSILAAFILAYVLGRFLHLILFSEEENLLANVCNGSSLVAMLAMLLVAMMRSSLNAVVHIDREVFRVTLRAGVLPLLTQRGSFVDVVRATGFTQSGFFHDRQITLHSAPESVRLRATWRRVSQEEGEWLVAEINDFISECKQPDPSVDAKVDIW